MSRLAFASRGVGRKVRLAAAVVAAAVVGVRAWGEEVPAYWVAPVSGNWNDGTKWSTAPTYPNGAGYDVVLNATGAAHTVTTATDGSINPWPSINRVTLDSADVTLAGGVTAKEVNVVNGTWRPFNNSFSSNARVTVGPDGRIDIPGSANVKWQDMTLASDLTVSGGATLNLGWGRVGLTLENSTVTFVGSQTSISGGSLRGQGRVVFTAPDNYTTEAFFDDNGVIDPGVEIRVERGNLKLGTDTWTRSFTNQGTVTIAPGRTAVLYGDRTVNRGVINVGDGGTLYLRGFASAADIGTVNRGANTTVVWAPTMVGGTGTAGLTLDLNAGPGGLKELGRAMLTRVTVTAAGRVAKVYGNPVYDFRDPSTLNGVTLAGDFDFQYGAGFNVVNGLNLGGAIHLGQRTQLTFNDLSAYPNVPQTLGGTGEVVFDGPGVSTGLTPSIYTGPTLTIGSGVTVQTGAGDGQIVTPLGSNLWPTVINEGTISARGAGRSITINASLVNHGTVEAVDGGTIALLAPFTNAGTIRLADSTLRLGGTSNYQTLGQLTASNSVVAITGTFDNTGRTLDLANPGPGFAMTLGQGGTIKGGTVTRGDGSALRVSGVAGWLTNAVVDVPIVVDGAAKSQLTFTGGRADGGFTVESGGSLTLQGARSDAPVVYAKHGSTVTIQGTSLAAPASVASLANFRLNRAALSLYLATMPTGAFRAMGATNAAVWVGSNSVLENSGDTVVFNGDPLSWELIGGKIVGGRIEAAPSTSGAEAKFSAYGTLENVTAAVSIAGPSINDPSLTIAGTFALEPNHGSPVSITVDKQVIFASGSASTIKGALAGTTGEAVVKSNARVTAQSVRGLFLTLNSGGNFALVATAEGGGLSHLRGISLQQTGARTFGGIFDIADVPVIADFVPYPRLWIASAYAGGTWGGTSGLTSSYAATHPGTGIGYIYAKDFLGSTQDPAGTILGETVAPTAMYIRVTLFGDATMDGVVNFSDLARLAQHYNLAGVWGGGDFNYDGVVNFSDLAMLAQNYNRSLPVPTGADVGLGSAAFREDLAAAFASVPEPGVMGLGVFLGGAAALRRRRRR